MVGEQKRDDMAQKTNQNQAPLLCSTGCGFNASPSNNGMCSVCYKDFLQRQSSSTQASPPGSSCCTEAQSSDSTTVSSPAAISPTDTECSEEMTASVNPTEASTSQGSCSLPTADDYCEAVKADKVVSQLEDESSAGSSGTGKSENSISVSQSSDEGKKRKFKDPTKNKEVYEASSSETSAEPTTEQEEKPKSTKKRCFVCRKKVGLSVLGFDCRCGKVFCSLHRYSDVHNCTFDYKADAAEKIRRENPVVIGEKIQKI